VVSFVGQDHIRCHVVPHHPKGDACNMVTVHHSSSLPYTLVLLLK